MCVCGNTSNGTKQGMQLVRCVVASDSLGQCRPQRSASGSGMRYRVSSCLRPLQGAHLCHISKGKDRGGEVTSRPACTAAPVTVHDLVLLLWCPLSPGPFLSGVGGGASGPETGPPPPPTPYPPPPLLPSRPALQSLARVRPCLHTYIHTTLQPRPSKFCPPPPPPSPLQQQVFFVFVKRSFGGWKHDMGVGGGGAVHT